MKGWMIRWLLGICALLLTAKIIPNFELTIWAAVVGSIFLGVINAIIRPFLKMLPINFTIIRLGILTLIINSFMIWVVGMTIRGFDLVGLLTLVAAMVLFSVFCFVINIAISDDRKYFR